MKRAAVVCVSFAGLAGVLLGYDIGMVAGVTQPIQNHFSADDDETELFVGALNGLAFVSCLLAPSLADRYGRRGLLGVAAGFFLASNALQAVATQFEALLVGRALAGVATGITVVVAPMYTAEISPSRWRGLFTASMELSFNLGIVLGMFATWAVKGMADKDLAWRLVMAMGCVPALLMVLAASFVMLESPRWLASQGRRPEAEEAFGRLVEAEEAELALEELAGTTRTPGLTGGRREQKPWRQLLWHGRTRKALLVGAMVSFFSQTTGLESLQNYMTQILEKCGYDRSMSLTVSLLVMVCKFLAIIISSAVVDSAGRRPLLLTSAVGVASAMGCMSFAVATTQGHLMAGGMVLFVVSFSLGFGPLVYVVNSEIFPQAFRSLGMSLSLGLARGLSAAVALSFLSLSNLLTYAGAFALFAGFGVASVLFVAFCVPETKGSTLESANRLLD